MVWSGRDGCTTSSEVFPWLSWKGCQMNHWLRRSLLGVGLALLVGGWGGIKYAEEQQRSQAIPPSAERPESAGWPGMMWGARYHRAPQRPQPQPSGWFDEYTLAPSSTIYRAGVLMMATGGLFIGFSLPKREERTAPEVY